MRMIFLFLLGYLVICVKNYVEFCHRASWGSAVRCKTRVRIERITRTAVLFDLPLGAFIAQISCNSCHI